MDIQEIEYFISNFEISKIFVISVDTSCARKI